MKLIQKWAQIALQVGLLTLVYLAGNWLAARLPWPVPGNVVGLLIMLLLLVTRGIRLEWVEAGANWLLAEMLLFFIPAAVGIVQYKNLIAGSGVRLLLVIGVSTALVMAATGVTAEYLSRRRGRSGGDERGAA